MKTLDKVAMYTALCGSLFMGSSLAVGFNRAGKDLARDGYKDVQVRFFPIHISDESAFKNDFTAKNAQGEPVSGTVSQNWKNSRHKVDLR